MNIYGKTQSGKLGILNNAKIIAKSISVMLPHSITLFPELLLKIRQKE